MRTTINSEERQMPKRRCKPMTLRISHHGLRGCFIGDDDEIPEKKEDRSYLSVSLDTVGVLSTDEPDEIVEVLLSMSGEEWRRLNARLCKNEWLDVTICGVTRGNTDGR